MKYEMTLFHTMGPDTPSFCDHIYGLVWSSFNIRWHSCATMCHWLCGITLSSNAVEAFSKCYENVDFPRHNTMGSGNYWHHIASTSLQTIWGESFQVQSLQSLKATQLAENKWRKLPKVELLLGEFFCPCLVPWIKVYWSFFVTKMVCFHYAVCWICIWV